MNLATLFFILIFAGVVGVLVYVIFIRKPTIVADVEDDDDEFDAPVGGYYPGVSPVSVVEHRHVYSTGPNPSLYVTPSPYRPSPSVVTVGPTIGDVVVAAALASSFDDDDDQPAFTDNSQPFAVDQTPFQGGGGSGGGAGSSGSWTPDPEPTRYEPAPTPDPDPPRYDPSPTYDSSPSPTYDSSSSFD